MRDRGHYAASLDPLAKQETEDKRRASWLPKSESDHPDVVRMLRPYYTSSSSRKLNLDPFQLEDLNLSARFELPGVGRETEKLWTLPSLIAFLADTYCSNVGVEFPEDDKQRQWLEKRVEDLGGSMKWGLGSKEEKVQVLEQLMRVDRTANFLTRTFPSSKVFGIEGCDALIPGLWGVAETGSSLGVECFEMGMAHRGRMNILHNFLQKSLSSICASFQEADPNELGDVKYHLGTRAQVKVGGKVVHVSLAANPSHLEAVNPVVLGKAKAKQFFIEDTDMTRVCPLLLHGDASFSGQGIVPETLELSNLEEYRVGGCVHLIVNNQIGFTTDPRDARTSLHCTNPAKGVGAPIFHVNADDVEAVVQVCRLAMEYRQQFGRDVVVDIVGYRRHGHNSLDDPSITIPLTTRLIKAHPAAIEIYTRKLLDQGVVTAEEVESLSKKMHDEYEAQYVASQSYTPDPLEWLASNWQGAAIGSLLNSRPYNQTGVRLSTLKAVGQALTRVPQGFSLHRDVEKLLATRRKILETGSGVTMAFAEALAFGSLLSKFSPGAETGLRGLSRQERTVESASQTINGLMLDVTMQEHPCVYIRLSGQDVIRGTFNQRHAALYDQVTGESYWQLNNLGLQEQATINVCNSSLSESAVLGFEYGYSLSNEMALTIWEGQFGDFANNAQAIIDNFITSGESKWGCFSSLVMLLPHGYDGQGPEHSSARVERFLSLVDDDEDAIPGKNASMRAEIEAGFDAISTKQGGVVDRAELGRILSRLSAGALPAERIELTLTEIMQELGTDQDKAITREAWCRVMDSWNIHNSERKSNLIVCAPSTPANYFHALRRQIHRPFSKPLVVFSGKWLLHHKACVSRLDDMAEGTFFQRVISEGGRGDNMQTQKRTIRLKPDAEIRRVILCSGKIFYHLYHAREAAGLDNVTIIRIEQIAPFPHDLLAPLLERFPNAREIVWCQEEPKNQGFWPFIRPRLQTCMRENGLDVKPLLYRGRKPSSSPASGGYSVHVTEQKTLIDAALFR